MGLTSAKDVNVGTRYSSCAVLLDGSVACWGGNTSGQLGDGTTTDRLTAVSVVGLSGASEVVVGGTHTCARLSGGEVSCWGSNEYGQVSNGNAGTDQRLTPTKVPGVSGVKQIILSNWSTHARMSDGTVRFWGYEGNAATSTAAALPSKIEGLSSVVEIYPGWHQRCARKADGTVRCWIGGTRESLAGKPLPAAFRSYKDGAGVKDAAEVVIGILHACARTQAGTVYCWGSSRDGELGDGVFGKKREERGPVLVKGLTDAAQVAAGDSHTCARKADGTVWCWGENRKGQLGDGTTERRAAPVKVAGLSDVKEITLGGDVSCARKADASVWCWGENSRGQVGDGSTEDTRTTPVKITFQ